ncbi:hypothetical protein Tco_0277464 [Tanacetum coccineum]
MGGPSSQPRTKPAMSPINAFQVEELYTPEFLDSFQENTGYWQQPEPHESPVEQVVTSPTRKNKAIRNRQKKAIESDDAPRQTAWTTEEEIALTKGTTTIHQLHLPSVSEYPPLKLRNPRIVIRNSILLGPKSFSEDGRQNRGLGNNARGGGTAGYGGAHNRVGNANPGQARQIKCYNCNGIGHIARNRTQPKHPQNSKYFKDKMLLMQAQENGVALDEEQLLFIAADDCDAFDSDVDEAPTAQTMFMANLSSVDPVYDEAGPSYDSDILSEVHDHDHYQDVVCEHHKEHEMHDDAQPTYVVGSHDDYMSDSNMIPYDQYLKDNAVLVIQSNVSSVPNDAYMMIFNDMHEPHAQSVSDTTRNIVVDNSLTAKLATYKEQVELYERRARFELTEREQKIDEQLRIVITDRNIKEENLKKELHSVKMQLASTINHNKSMVEEDTSLKKHFKQKENKYLEEFLDMKALKEKVKDKLYKQDQSLQTVHMLCKPKPYYNEQNKVAIGYKNPLCLTRAKQVQPALYNGHEIIKNNHVPAIVHNTKDTLEIADITRRTMNDKMKDPECVNHKVKIAPPDYSKENYLATFTPQKQLTPEQIFWSQYLIKMKTKALKKQTITSRPIKALTVYPINTPAMLVPRVLPTKKLEAEVDQNVVDRKHDEIEWKNLLIAHDNLIADCLSKEVFYVATNSELNVSRFTEMHDAHTIVEARCLELEAELSNLRDKIQKDNHNELVKLFSNLEVNHLNMQLKYQNRKESFRNNPSTPARDTPDFDSVFVIGKMEASLQGKDNITQLTEKVSVLLEENEFFRAENEKVKHHYKELYDSIKITLAKHIEQTMALLTKNENLKAQIHENLKCNTMESIKPSVLAPDRYAIDVEPIPPYNRNNRTNTKKNRISPAKGANKKKVEEHPRTNKSNLRTTNRVDSSSSSKHTVINSNSDFVCQTCNKCLKSANHDVCVVDYLQSVKASHSIHNIHNVVRKVKKVWKPKQVRQVWKLTGKVLTSVGHQWRPTGRIFTLGEQCPLTRITKPKVAPAKQNNTFRSKSGSTVSFLSIAFSY